MAEPYDVVVIIPSLGRSGGLRVLCEWSARLAATGRRVAVAAAARGPGEELLGPGVDVYAPRRIRHLLDEVEVRVRRRRAGPAADLYVYPRAARRGLPRGRRYVLGFAPWQEQLDLDGPVLPYCQHWEPVWFEGSPAATQLAERAMAAAGDKVVNSTWLRDHWAPSRRGELHLVHPGVDLDVYQPGPRPPVTGRLRIAALGREDVPWKGVAQLRQALTRSGVPADLVLFGTPGTYAVDRPWGSERAVGSLAQAALADLFRSVDVVATPSWYESFPLPPLEAMACGTAVVTTREGTEDYAVDRVNALVVPGRDVDALAAAIAELSHDEQLRATLAAAGPSTAQRFSWAAGFRSFEKVLEQTEPPAA